MVKKSNRYSPEEQYLDDSFGCLLRVAQAICATLARPKDRSICSTTLESLIKFNRASTMETKENLHIFLRFYMAVLRWTQTHQPLAIYQKWYHDSNPQGHETSMKLPQDEVHHWLDPGHSYVAMKHFDDGSSIIYSAISKDPSSGWVENGFGSLTDRNRK